MHIHIHMAWKASQRPGDHRQEPRVLGHGLRRAAIHARARTRVHAHRRAHVHARGHAHARTRGALSLP